MNWLEKLKAKVGGAGAPSPREESGPAERVDTGTILREPVASVPAADQPAAVVPTLGVPPDHRWRVGDLILDLYDVKQIYEGGGMGLVYKVHHRGWNIDLAVKSPRAEYFRTEIDRENFTGECERWITLGLHPHLVSCYYVRTVNDIPHVFAEYVEGGSLQEWIESRRLYQGGPEEALKAILDIAIQTAWGLQYAHEQGLIHQDVKPANILMVPDGTAKITDFGLARARALVEELIAGRGALVSSGGMTPAYCSPEQACFAPLSHKTDIWSWGLSVLEMFVGAARWQSGILAPYELKRFRDVRINGVGIPEPPPELLELLGQCFDMEPARRPENFLIVADRLQSLFTKVVGEAYLRETPDAPKLQADALNNRAISMLDLGRVVEAERLFGQALAQDPYHPQASYNRGLHSWRKVEGTDDAIVKALEHSRANRPDDWNVPYLLGLVHLERCDAEGAMNALFAAEKLSGCAEVQLALATARRIYASASNRPRTFEGHSAGVRSIALNADGAWAVSGGADSTVRLWELNSGKLVRTFQGHTESVNSVALSVDGRWALSGSGDKAIRLWDLSSGRCLRAFDGHKHSVESVALSADGTWALSGSWDKTLRLWEINSGQCVRVFGGLQHPVLSVALSADARWACSASRDNKVRLWEVNSGTCIRTFEGHSSPVQSVALSDDGCWVLSGSGSSLGVEDKTLRLWEVSSGKCLTIFDGHTNGVNSVALSRNGRLALSASRDNTVRLWDVQTGRCLRTFEGHNGAVQSVVLDEDGLCAFSGGADKTIRRWDLKEFVDPSRTLSVPTVVCQVTRANDVLALEKRFRFLMNSARKAFESGSFASARSFAAEARALPGYNFSSEALELSHQAGLRGQRIGLRDAWSRRTFEGHTERVYSVDLSGNGNWAVSASQDKTVRLWEVSSGRCIGILEGHDDWVKAATLSKDGRWVISASTDRTVRVWDATSGVCVETLEGHTGWVQKAAFNADARFIFSGSDDKTVRVWAVGSGTCLKTLVGHRYQVKSLAVNADGSRVLSGSDDGTILYWDVGSGMCLRTFEGHTLDVNSVFLSADGLRACSGSKDKTLRLWEVSSGQCLGVLEGHTKNVTSVALSPDGRWALSGSEDETVRLWDTSNGRCIRTFEGHASWLASVALSPDGRWVLAGGDDKTVRLWELDWDYEFHEPRDWDDGAKLCVESFINLHCAIGDDSVNRIGQPAWAEDDFQSLLVDLQHCGYGWLRAEGVRHQLEEMTKGWQGPTVNPTDLRDAVVAGDSAKFKALLDKCQDVDAKTTNGTTALMMASELGHHEMVRALLDHGAQVDARMVDGWSALLHASFRGHLAVVHALLDKGSNVETMELKTGATALMLAAQEGHTQIIRTLVSKGANVDARSNSGETALILAAHVGHAEVVRALLEHGAEINAKNNDGGTALMSASFVGDDETVRVLLANDADGNLQKNDGTTAIMMAVQKGHHEAVVALLARGANVNAEMPDGTTALMTASGLGHLAVVRSLLGAGAQANAKTNNGATALLMAAQEGHRDVVLALLQKGAKVNAKEDEGIKALILRAGSKATPRD